MKIYPDVSDLIGKPFVDMGRGPDGYDCWGVVIEVKRRFGIYVPDYKDVHWWEIKKIKNYIKNDLNYLFVKVDNYIPSDLVIFKKSLGRLHFGVMSDPYYCIHADIDFGVIRNRLDSNLLNKQKIEGFYRCKI